MDGKDESTEFLKEYMNSYIEQNPPSLSFLIYYIIKIMIYLIIDIIIITLLLLLCLTYFLLFHQYHIYFFFENIYIYIYILNNLPAKYPLYAIKSVLLAFFSPSNTWLPTFIKSSHVFGTFSPYLSKYSSL